MKKKKVEGYIILLQQQLGQGSYGKVYKGTHQQTKQIVAIKVLNKKDIDNDEYVKQALMSEIKIMKKLKSDNLVRFIDVLTTPNNYYIIQEFCNGGDLRGKMKKQKIFTQKSALQYLQQICLAFQFLITNGIIHRDVKPQNILIHQGKLKLADFGFAKNVQSRSQLNNSVVGTPLYMAPQVLKNQKYSSKCDIWAVGLIFYQLLYGKIPWSGRSEYELVNNTLNIPLKFPTTPVISELAKQFIEKCLKIQQKQRLSWDQIYSHPIFGGKFKYAEQKNQKLNEKSKYVINKLRLKVHSDNVDLQKLFHNLKLNNETAMKKTQFFQLLNTLHQDIDQQEAEFVFDKFDSDKNGTIQFTQFKKSLEQNDIRMKSIRINNFIKRYSTNSQQKSPSNEDLKVNQVINKLILKIESQKLDLFRVYSSYDKSKTDALSFDEFKKLLGKIDKNLTQVQQRICFQRFDLNGDKKISFDQFYKTICKIVGQSSNLKNNKYTKSHSMPSK